MDTLDTDRPTRTSKFPAARPIRGKGWIQDAQENRSKVTSAKHLLGAAARLPSEMSWEHFIGKRDQSITNSCFGMAASIALRARRCVELKADSYEDVPEYAAKTIYGMARIRARTNKKDPILDKGSIPFFGMMAMSEWGVPFERDDPFTVEGINDEPAFDVIERANSHKLTGYYAIDSEGYDRLQDIQHALAEGHFPIFGAPVDHAFEDYSGGDPIDSVSMQKIEGYHMMTVCGYRGELLRCYSSWADWGDRGSGFYWCTPGFMADARVSDIYVLTSAPR